MCAAGDQSGKVCHVDEVERADFVGDLAHAGEIDDARVGAAAADDHLGALFLRDAFQFVVVDGFGFFGDAVGNDLVGLAGKIQLMAVGEVSAVGQVQAEDGVAGLKDGGVGRHVGLRSGVRLDVGVLGAEQLLGALAGQVFDDVGEFAAAVVALAGIAFGILVREHRAGSFEHGFADEVLGRDQLQAFVLAAGFVVDGSGDLGIDFGERTGHG